MNQKNRKSLRFIKVVYILGIILFLYIISVFSIKINEMIMNNKTILTMSLEFQKDFLIISSILSGIILFLIFKSDKKKFWQYLKGFMSWAVYLSISGIFLYFILLLPILKKFANIVVIVTFFALYILHRLLDEKTSPS